MGDLCSVETLRAVPALDIVAAAERDGIKTITRDVSAYRGAAVLTGYRPQVFSVEEIPDKHYDVAIMTSRTQVTLDPELQLRARARAAALGISFAEYIRRLVAHDLAGPELRGNPAVLFNLGSSSGSDVAREKDRMVGEAVTAEHPSVRG